MSRMSNESEDGMLYNYQNESPVMDDGNGGSSGGGVILKKGPWTSNEDAILVEYVKKHGEGNWNAVQKHSGLSRCGKSCRLRWANHLRPDLRKGAFTHEEETLILELHAKMGNKWARMASYLPGRTDNEIKNYWNTRVKRRQRAGLPLYPLDMHAQVLQENQQAENAGSLSCEEFGQHETMQSNNSLEIPTIKFDGLVPSHRRYDLYSMLHHQLYNHGAQTMQPQKCIGGSPNALMKVLLPQNEQFPNDKASSFFGDPFSQEFDPVQSLSYFDTAQGPHSLPNGNPSASVPVNGVVKLELPSLQYPDTDLSNTWGNSSLLPSLESVDTYIRSPAQANGAQFGLVKQENSGLLGDLIQEAMHLSRVKNFPEKNLNSSSFTPADGILGTCANDWDGNTEPPSPLGQSPTSFLNECISPGGSSFDDASLTEHLIGGNHVKPELFEMVFTPNKENESKKPMEFIQPDALFDFDWPYCSSAGNGRETMTDAIATLMGSDLVSDFNIEVGSGSSSSVQDSSYSRCLWDTMPSAVCQMSDRH